MTFSLSCWWLDCDYFYRWWRFFRVGFFEGMAGGSVVFVGRVIARRIGEVINACMRALIWKPMHLTNFFEITGLSNTE